MKLNPQCAGCFGSLACGTRVEIINLLQKEKRLSVLTIAKHFKTSQPTISHHLKYLRDIGLLKSEREGRKIYYFLDPKCGWDNCEVVA
jgi:ArsR family transcriptional regulator